jgi:SAM-dependent methyltransferase
MGWQAMRGRLKALARNWAVAFLYPRPLVGLFYLPRFIRHCIKYRQMAGSRMVLLLDMQPCLGDWSFHTPVDPHYFYQGAWLARQLSKSIPAKHVDIGSSALTMSVLSAWVDTVFVDYRPLKLSLRGLTSVAGDILNLPFGSGSVFSVSCMHVIEHIGLGRYGEPLDPQGSIKAALELQRILCPGGRLFLSLPIGHERVNFNAHRVHSPDSVLNMFPLLKLVEFSYVDDEGRFMEYRQPAAATDLQYGCGMFVFKKP